MNNKKAKQLIERLTGAYYANISIPFYHHGYRVKKLVYCLAKNNGEYKQNKYTD